MIERWTGEKPRLGCSCMRWIKKMDKNPEWAKNHVDLIAEKLLKEARRRAGKWRASPMDDAGGLVKAVKRAAWKGAFMVPGAGITLAVLVRQMVEEAIRRAGNEEA
jgi:hypothetical protein